MPTRFLFVSFVVLFGMAGAGCQLLGIGPSKDPDWPGGDTWGEKPVPVNQTFTVSSPSGNVIFFIEKMTPRENGTARVGQKAQIWARVTNDSQKFLAIQKTLSKGPDDRPGESGDISELFGGHGHDLFNPGQVIDQIFGFTVRQPEEVSWLRFAGNYETRTHADGRPNFQIWPGLKPEWTYDIHLGWSLTPQ